MSLKAEHPDLEVHIFAENDESSEFQYNSEEIKSVEICPYFTDKDGKILTDSEDIENYISDEFELAGIVYDDALVEQQYDKIVTTLAIVVWIGLI